jgi:hypothetical protein
LFLRTQTQPKARRAVVAGLATAAITVSALAASPALAGSGGTGANPPPPTTTSGDRAKLVDGYAVAPRSAPRRVKHVIAAANEIAKHHGYCLGGGHQSWKSSCYDCSGAVSYALHGGRLLSSPLPSGSLAKWGNRGRGRWIAVFANGGHAFMKVAGLRFDTSDTAGAGPGWAKGMGWESTQSYAVRHKRY